MIYEQNGNDTVIFLDMAAAAENKTGPRFVDNLPGFTNGNQEKKF
jgi:hypothetical protein